MRESRRIVRVAVRRGTKASRRRWTKSTVRECSIAEVGRRVAFANMRAHGLDAPCCLARTLAIMRSCAKTGGNNFLESARSMGSPLRASRFPLLPRVALCLRMFGDRTAAKFGQPMVSISTWGTLRRGLDFPGCWRVWLPVARICCWWVAQCRCSLLSCADPRYHALVR